MAERRRRRPVVTSVSTDNTDCLDDAGDVARGQNWCHLNSNLNHGRLSYANREHHA